MATIYGKNYQAALVSKPASMVHAGEYNGREKVTIDTLTFSAELASGDVAKVGQLPANARVLAARVFGPALGGSGTATLGHGGDGVTAAKPDAFIAAIASGAAAFDVSDKDSRGSEIQGVRFVAPTDVLLTFTGVSTSATGKAVQVKVSFIVD